MKPLFRETFCEGNARRKVTAGAAAGDDEAFLFHLKFGGSREYGCGPIANRVADQPDEDEHDDDVTAAVTDKGERHAFGREHAEVDEHIDEGLQEDKKHRAQTDVEVEDVGNFPQLREDESEEDEEKHDDEGRTAEAEFFGDDGEDAVRVGFGEEAAVNHAVAEAFAVGSAAGDAGKGLPELVALVVLKAFRIEKGENAVEAVFPLPDRDREDRYPAQDRRHDVQEASAREEEHGQADSRAECHGPEVRFDDDAHADYAEDPAGEEEAAEEIRDGFAGREKEVFPAAPKPLDARREKVAPGYGEVVSEDENQDNLCGVADLEVDDSEVNPASGAVDDFPESGNVYRKEKEDGRDQPPPSALAEILEIDAGGDDVGCQGRDEVKRLHVGRVERLPAVVVLARACLNNQPENRK